MRADEVVGQGPKDVTKPWWDDSETDHLHIEAATWLERLGRPEGKVSAKDISEFCEWRDKDPRHASAFVRLVEVSYKVAATSAQRESDLRKLSKDAYMGDVPLGKVREEPRRRRITYVAAASVALAISLSLALLALGHANFGFFASLTRGEVSEEVVETPVGDNRTVVLADGSRATLGGYTRMQVAFDKHERTIRLSRGEVYFEVAKEPARNFVVHVGSINVTAVGTAFNVNQAGRKAVVTVTEGGVFVEPAVRPPGVLQLRRVRLNAGEQSTVDESGIGEPIAVTDLASILSWQSGRLSFRRRPLADAIRDVNRYASKPLSVATPAIGEISVTGTVAANNIAGWITSLERAFDLKAVEDPDRIILHAAEEKP